MDRAHAETGKHAVAVLNASNAYVQKQMEKNRRIDLDDLFVRGFDIRWNEELQDSYVYQIPAIANIDHFEFKSNITFFVGENGSGKIHIAGSICGSMWSEPGRWYSQL